METTTNITTTEELSKKYAEVGLSADWYTRTWQLEGDYKNGFVITHEEEQDEYTLISHYYCEDDEERVCNDIVTGTISECMANYNAIKKTERGHTVTSTEIITYYELNKGKGYHNAISLTAANFDISEETVIKTLDNLIKDDIHYFPEQNSNVTAFKDACIERNSLQELQEALTSPLDDEDTKEYSLSADQYYSAIREAIKYKLAE